MQSGATRPAEGELVKYLKVSMEKLEKQVYSDLNNIMLKKKNITHKFPESSCHGRSCYDQLPADHFKPTGSCSDQRQ